MEHQTRFDLNAALESWRTELAAQPNLTQDARRELETHMQDTLAELRRRGLSDEEAFWLARRRTGSPEQLGDEFIKANPAKVWRERIFWVAIFCLIFEFWTQMANAFRITFPSLFDNGILSVLFYKTIIYGPIIWVVFDLATGRTSKINRMADVLFRSPLNLVVVCTLTSLLLMAYDCLMIYLHYLRIFVQAQSPVSIQYEWILVYDGINYGVLLGLIAWLMPRKRLALKHT
ncbi:MAG TPA: permease prefix domain 1-containing protein [Verrucomicrobiae bacterium]|jgi:hypothetical protein